MLPTPVRLTGKEVNMVGLFSLIISFLISVLAGIAANFVFEAICKWLNGRKK